MGLRTRLLVVSRRVGVVVLADVLIIEWLKVDLIGRGAGSSWGWDLYTYCSREIFMTALLMSDDVYSFLYPPSLSRFRDKGGGDSQ